MRSCARCAFPKIRTITVQGKLGRGGELIPDLTREPRVVKRGTACELDGVCLKAQLSGVADLEDDLRAPLELPARARPLDPFEDPARAVRQAA